MSFSQGVKGWFYIQKLSNVIYHINEENIMQSFQ